MVYFDPQLGVQLPERSYADQCDLSLETFKVSFLPSGLG